METGREFATAIFIASLKSTSSLDEHSTVIFEPTKNVLCMRQDRREAIRMSIMLALGGSPLNLDSIEGNE